MKVMQVFTVFWLNGDVQHITGTDAAQAMNRHGIAPGALAAIDFYAEGRYSSAAEWHKEWEEQRKKERNQ